MPQNFKTVKTGRSLKQPKRFLSYMSNRLRAVLYFNAQNRDGNPAFNPGQPLEPLTYIVGVTEMSNYG